MSMRVTTQTLHGANGRESPLLKRIWKRLAGALAEEHVCAMPSRQGHWIAVGGYDDGGTDYTCPECGAKWVRAPEY